MFKERFSSPSSLNEWKKKNNEPKKETNSASASRSVEDIIKEKKKMIAKNKEIRETVYSRNFEGAEKITRRDFLKVGGALAVLWAIGKYGNIEKALGSLPMEETAAGEAQKILEKKEVIEKKENFDEEIHYDGEKPDIKAIESIFDFNSKGSIKVNLATAEQLKEYWKHKYATKMKSDLVGAMEGIKPFIPKLKNIFAEYGVPEEYALLAIPESHWKLDAVSEAGAEGPYQFMPATGEDYGLMTSEDRRDPIKSADACAHFLKDLYGRTDDWNLALAGYNGGFMGRYLKKCKHDKTQPTYANFLIYLTGKANRIKSEVRQKLFVWHKVEKKETLLALSKKFNLNINTISKYNKIQGTNLKAGQMIKIPISNAEKSKLFESKIRDIANNLNYPPKFLAVYELVENTIAWSKEGNKDSKA
jgi:LysM repeat protein